MLFGTGCDKLKSRDQLNRGVAAYKSAKYAEAIENFKTAIALDPTNPNAAVSGHGVHDPMDSGRGIAGKHRTRHPGQKGVPGGSDQGSQGQGRLASLASLAFNQSGSLQGDAKTAKLDEARDWNQKLIAVDPKNKEAYYSLGVIAWTKWYPVLGKERAELGMKPEDPGPIKDKKIREELKQQYSAVIEEGIDPSDKALEIDPEYDDAMAYLNLLIRERADLADSPDAVQGADQSRRRLGAEGARNQERRRKRRPAGRDGITQEHSSRN